MKPHQPLPNFAVIAFFVFAALLLGLGLGRSGFEGKDERRYAEVAKEIGSGSDFFVMHLLGDLYPDKPPLFFWSQAACYKIMGGTTPLAARLPLFFSALLALAFAYGFIRRLEGDVAALAGTALILLSFRFFWSARWARLDMPMTAATFGSFWASARLLFPRPDEGTARRDEWLWAMCAWFFGALTILSKGPGVLVWMGSIGLYAAVMRDMKIVRKHRPLIGLAFMFALALAWFVPAAIMGGRDYWEPMLKIHVVERAIGVVRHDQPWYYYSKIIYDAFPMGLFLPVALVNAVRGRKADPRTAFALWAFIFGFVFFSLPAGKRGQYILPVYLPIGALTGRLIAEGLAAGATRGARRLVVAMTGLLAFVILGAGLASPWLYALVAADFPSMPGTESAYAVANVCLAVLLVPALILALRGRITASLSLSLGVCSVLYLALFLYLLPQNRSDATPREIAHKVDTELGSWKQLAVFALDEKYTLYGRELPVIVKNSPDAVKFMGGGGKRWLLAPARKLPRLTEAAGGMPWRRVGQWSDAADEHVIVLFESGS